jgi:predicted nucleotidyltransferase
MYRSDVIARIKAVEPALRARGVGSLYLFGSHGRNEGRPDSDDVFVDVGDDSFYDLSNFMGAYEDLRRAFPDRQIGYATCEGLSQAVRPMVEREAIRVF